MEKGFSFGLGGEMKKEFPLEKEGERRWARGCAEGKEIGRNRF